MFLQQATRFHVGANAVNRQFNETKNKFFVQAKDVTDK